MPDSEFLRRRLEEAAEEHRRGLIAGKWWHSIDLGDGRITPGVHPLEELRRNYARLRLPDDLRGKRLLDIGCWDGFYSFEAERRGAEVVAVDCWQPKNFFVAHRALRSRVQFHEMSVYEVSKQRLGTFDYVLFLAVLYHLRHPLLALERVCEVTRDVAVIESHVIDNLFPFPEPVMQFYEFDELGGQFDNWWGPNSDCARRMARAAGFAWTEILDQEPTRVVFKAGRRWPAARLESRPSLRVLNVVNAVTGKPAFTCSGAYSFVSVFVEGLPPAATRDTVRVELEGFGVVPAVVVHTPAPDGPGYTQVNVAIPPGLDPGPARLRVLSGERCSPEVTISLAEGTTCVETHSPAYAPAILPDPEGAGRSRIFIAGAEASARRRPARRGTDVLEIFCSGLGPVSNPPPAGAPASDNPLSETVLVPLVTIGGVPADVIFSGLVPGEVGLYQVSVPVPAEAPTGPAVPVVLRIGGATSDIVTIAVE
ncbi:MAG TPA: methyltransferase domain-containing protein [Candidatus Xenobia bacterium]|nr:methyltransferase domain-containing protein [Candidatus Xenobia bacterium]